MHQYYADVDVALYTQECSEDRKDNKLCLYNEFISLPVSLMQERVENVSCASVKIELVE